MKQVVARAWFLSVVGFAGCAVGSPPEASVALDGPRGAAAPPASSSAEAGAPATDENREPTAEPPTDTRGVGDAGKEASDGLADAAGATDGACAFAGELVTFDATKLQGSVELPPAAQAPGLTASHVSRSGVTAVPSSGAMNSSNWPTGAADRDKYYAFRITPPAGCALTVTALTVALKSSNSGPATAAVGTSVDDFGALETVGTTGSSVTVALTGIQRITVPLEVRVFGFHADASGGTLRIQNKVALTGTLSAL